VTHLDELRETIRRLHGLESEHVDSVPVKETFHGETVWDGIVEVFEVKGHPKIPRVYAWLHKQGRGHQHVTVLHIAPITSAVQAVRASIIQEFRNLGTSTEEN
jgi:hypothetical protein